MARTIVPTDFFSEVFHGVQTVPMKGYVLATGVGLLGITIDLIFRHLGGRYSAPEYAVFGVAAVFSLAALYGIAMMIVEAPATWSGGLRFLSIMILSIGLPLCALFGSLWLMHGSDRGAAISALLLSVFLILFGLPLPTAQALSDHFVSPIRILRATKGHRWGLLTASFASTAITKMIPATDTAKSGGQALLLAVGNGATTCASLVLLASIAATAWKFAVQKDPALAGPVDKVDEAG